MTPRILTASAAILALLWLSADTRAPEPHHHPARETGVLDQRRFDYPEDEHRGRCLADVHVVLERLGNDVGLRIVASAVGPSVDPIPGWQGVRGANRITAEELASIVAKNRMRVETDGPEPQAGTATIGRRGRIPERRRGADGLLEVAAATDVDYALELIATTGALADGVRRTRLVVDGVTRLEVTISVHDGGGRILDVRALSGGHDVGRDP